MMSRPQKLFSNKKGVAADMYIFMLVHVPMIIIVLFGMVIITNKYVIMTEDTSKIETEIILFSILTNPDLFKGEQGAFGEKDITLIDASEFLSMTDEDMNEIYDFGDFPKLFSARISLYNFDGSPYVGTSGTVADSTLYINPDYFRSWFELSKGGVFGPGSTTATSKKMYVNIVDGEDIKKGFLEVVVVVPRS